MYLSKHKVELCIGLIHLITFQQAEVRTTQQVILYDTHTHDHTAMTISLPPF